MISWDQAPKWPQTSAGEESGSVLGMARGTEWERKGHMGGGPGRQATRKPERSLRLCDFK